MWREEGKGYRIPCGDSAKVSRAALSQVACRRVAAPIGRRRRRSA